MFKALGKLILALNGNVKKSQIAAGIAWGVLLGLIPAGNLFWIVIFLVSFFFRHHHGAKLFGMAIMMIVSPLIAYQIHSFGEWILYIEPLKPYFTTMYNMPFVPFTKFNNTLVMGGLVSGIILWIPVFALFMLLIPLYRDHVAVKIRNSKFIQTIAKFPLLKSIEKSLFKD